MVRLASIDIGSNAMRLEIVEISENELFDPKIPIHDISITPVNFAEGGSRIRMPIRLGYEAFLQNFFSHDKIMEVLSAFEYFKFELERNNVDYYLTSATSASRESTNGYEIPKIIYEKTGIRYRIIDGRKESQLLNLALSSFYKSKSVKDILIDLGGGSLEINIRDSGTVFFQDSLPVGTVRLMIESKSNEEKMVEIINEKLYRVKRFFDKQNFIERFDYYLVPGGNAEDIVLMAKRFFGFDYKSKSSFIEMPLDYVDQIIKLIKPVPSKLRAFKFNLRADRADVIFQAATIFKRIGEFSGIDTISIPKINLNDGIIFDLITRLRRMQNLGIDVQSSALTLRSTKS